MLKEILILLLFVLSAGKSRELGDSLSDVHEGSHNNVLEEGTILNSQFEAVFQWIFKGIKSTFPYKLVVLHIYVIFFLFIPMVIVCGFLSPVQLFPDWKWPQCEGDDLFLVDQGDLDSSAATTSQNETVTSPDHIQPQYLNPTPCKPIIKFCKELPPETPHIEQKRDMRSPLLTLTEEKSGEQASRPSAQEPEFLDAADVQSAGTLPLLQSVEYKMCSSLHLNLRTHSIIVAAGILLSLFGIYRLFRK
ncbi:uncharacterized protein [Porites lutea]|uniref:uncharacterized protein n=1 Tax=Porites lutea TaxID=51062 RepID=UPI003CC6CEFD